MKIINELLEDIEYLVGESEDDNCEDSKFYLSKILKDIIIIREILDELNLKQVPLGDVIDKIEKAENFIKRTNWK